MIDKASRADSGTYKVKLSNEAGEAECPVVIKVIGNVTYNFSHLPSHLVMLLKHRLFTYTDTLLLIRIHLQYTCITLCIFICVCTKISCSYPTIFHIVVNCKVKCISIPMVMYESVDKSYYQNNHSSWEFLLHFADKPTSPRDLQTKETWADNILIDWKEPEDDGGQPILHYIVECKNMSKRGQDWTKAGKTPLISIYFNSMTYNI